ncbi:MAG: DUF2334 domain-containing protein [Colwellia sp.]|jgi:Predicted deacetylase
MAKYILRLDDACPTMDVKKWQRIESLLGKYGISPIVAVVPANEDPKLNLNDFDPAFWQNVKNWQKKGWCIALHGYDHKYISTSSGFLPFNKKSEFAGLLPAVQEEKIDKAVHIFNQYQLNPRCWVAPSHTFDEQTLTALKNKSNVSIISDGLSYRPYKRKGFIWVPQQLWRFYDMPFGIWTICLHPNVMDENEFNSIEKILQKHGRKFVAVESVIGRVADYSLSDMIFNCVFRVLYFFKTKLRS